MCFYVWIEHFHIEKFPKKKKKKIVMGQSKKLIAKKNSECPQLIKMDHKDITIMFNNTNVNNNVEEGEG